MNKVFTLRFITTLFFQKYKWIIAVCTVCLGMIPVYNFFWTQLERRLETTLNRYITLLKERGWDIPKFTYQKSGWPFSTKIIIDNMKLQGNLPFINKDIQWSGREITFKYTVVHPLTITLEVNGLQAISLHSKNVLPSAADTIHTVPDIRFWAKTFSLYLPAFSLSNTVNIVANSFYITFSGSGPDNIASIPELKGKLSLEKKPPSNAIYLLFSANTIQLPASLPWPYNRTLTNTKWENTFTETFPSTNTVKESRKYTRQNTNTKIFINKAQTDWGPLHISSTGDFIFSTPADTFSINTPPLFSTRGHFIVTLFKYNDTLEKLYKHHAFSESTYKIVKTYLSILSSAQPEPSGKKRETDDQEVSFPVSLENGHFFLGKIPLDPTLLWIARIMSYNIAPSIVKTQ